MMRFAMNVVGYGSAYGYELGPGADHRHPPTGSKCGDNFVKACAGFTFQDAQFFIPRKKMMHPGANAHFFIAMDGLVAVTPAQSPCNNRFLRNAFL